MPDSLIDLLGDEDSLTDEEFAALSASINAKAEKIEADLAAKLDGKPAANPAADPNPNPDPDPGEPEEEPVKPRTFEELAKRIGPKNEEA